VLELDGRQVQLQILLCSANHGICYYDIYHKSNENADKITINMLQRCSYNSKTLFLGGKNKLEC